MTNPCHSGETAKPKKKKPCDDLTKQMEPRNPDYSQDWDCPDVFPAKEDAGIKAERGELENIKTIQKQPKE